MSINDLQVSLAEQSELDPGLRASIGALLQSASPTGLNRFTWDNSVHSVHILGNAGGQLVAYGLLSERAAWIDGQEVRAGFVESVAVATDRRGRGYGRTLAGETEALIRAEFELGVVSVSQEMAKTVALRGWRRWEGTTWSRNGSQLTRTELDDGRVYVLETRAQRAALDGEIAIDWRDADVW